MHACTSTRPHGSAHPASPERIHQRTPIPCAHTIHHARTSSACSHMQPIRCVPPIHVRKPIPCAGPYAARAPASQAHPPARARFQSPCAPQPHLRRHALLSHICPSASATRSQLQGAHGGTPCAHVYPASPKSDHQPRPPAHSYLVPYDTRTLSAHIGRPKCFHQPHPQPVASQSHTACAHPTRIWPVPNAASSRIHTLAPSPNSLPIPFPLILHTRTSITMPTFSPIHMGVFPSPSCAPLAPRNAWRTHAAVNQAHPHRPSASHMSVQRIWRA